MAPAQIQVWKEMEELIWVWPCWNQQQNCPWFTWCSSAWFTLSSKVLGTSVNQIPGIEEHSAGDSHWEVRLYDSLGSSGQQQQRWDRGTSQHPAWSCHSGVLHPPPVTEQGLEGYSVSVTPAQDWKGLSDRGPMGNWCMNMSWGTVMGCIIYQWP